MSQIGIHVTPSGNKQTPTSGVDSRYLCFLLDINLCKLYQDAINHSSDYLHCRYSALYEDYYRGDVEHFYERVYYYYYHGRAPLRLRLLLGPYA